MNNQEVPTKEHPLDGQSSQHQTHQPAFKWTTPHLIMILGNKTAGKDFVLPSESTTPSLLTYGVS